MGCASSKLDDPWQLAQFGATGTLSQWLVNGGSPNAVDKLKGRGSLLHCAAAADHVDCIKLLVRNKADVNVATPDHGTPLHAAAGAGASNAVTQLLAYGACTTTRFRGQTAAELAQESGYPAIARFIQMNHGKSSSDPDSRSTDYGSIDSVTLPPETPGPLLLAASPAGAPPRAQRHLDAQQRLMAEGQRHMEKLQALQVRERLAQARRQMQAAEAGGAQGGVPRTTSDPSELAAGRPRPEGPPSSVSMPPFRGGSSLEPHPRPGSGSRLQPAQPVLPDQGRQERQPPTAPPNGQPGGATERRNPRAPASARGSDAAPSPRTSKPGVEAASSPRTLQRANEASDPSTPAAAGADHAAIASLAGQLAALEPVSTSELGSGGSSSGPDGSDRSQGGAADAPAVLQQAQQVQQAQQHPRSMHPSRGDLGRIPSGELPCKEGLENGASGSNSGSNSNGSSANNSLLDDPLLKFLKQALDRQPSGLSQQSPGGMPRASPFASVAAAPGGGHGGEAAGAPAGGGPQHLPGGAASSGSFRLQSSGSSGEAPLRGRTLSSPLNCGLVSAGSISIDIRPWQIEFEDLQLQKKTIGEGSFGKVYVAKWHETLVAVKVLLDLEEAAQQRSAEAAWTLSNPILQNLQKECALMASLRHPNVVQFMGVSAMPPAMISEYCGRGSLNDVLKACSNSRSRTAQMTWLRRLNMALDATKGMLYLHRRGIIHRDLKSPNLLVESTWRVKVADFNLSKIVEDTSSGRSTIANMNPRWLAPEILNGEPATTASDVFSWGVVMWELLTFQCPWPHTSPWALVGKLMDGHRLAIPPRDQLPGPDTASFAGLDAYIALMQRCWAQNPADRPDFTEVIRLLRKLLESHARLAPSGSG